MDKKTFYRIFFYYEVLLNVLFWIIYDPLRELIGVYVLAGVVLFLLIGVPAVLYLYSSSPNGDGSGSPSVTWMNIPGKERRLPGGLYRPLPGAR